MQSTTYVPSSLFEVPTLSMQQQQQQQPPLRDPIERRVLHLNNKACVLVLSETGDYSEANRLFETALQMHKEHTEEGCYQSSSSSSSSYAAGVSALHAHATAVAPPATHLPHPEHTCYHNNRDASVHTFTSEFEHSDSDLSAWDNGDECDMKDPPPVHAPQHHNPLASASHLMRGQEATTTTSGHKISRLTASSRLPVRSYTGQQDHSDEEDEPKHQVYGLPIAMDTHEWDHAPTQDRSFVLIFNTAVCNHLWGMQLLQQYHEAMEHQQFTLHAIHSLAQHCKETLTVAKLLYKLALENSVSFANGVDKMCYVALYNNLSHVGKTLDGYHSTEAAWCDEMLLKAIFWWRDSTHPSSRYYQNHQHGHTTLDHSSSHSSSSSPRSDLYRDDDDEIIDAFLDHVFYRIAQPEDVAPAAAA